MVTGISGLFVSLQHGDDFIDGDVLIIHLLVDAIDLGLDLGGQVVGEGVLQGLDNQIKLAFH